MGVKSPTVLMRTAGTAFVRGSVAAGFGVAGGAVGASLLEHLSNDQVQQAEGMIAVRAVSSLAGNVTAGAAVTGLSALSQGASVKQAKHIAMQNALWAAVLSSAMNVGSAYRQYSSIHSSPATCVQPSNAATNAAALASPEVSHDAHADVSHDIDADISHHADISIDHVDVCHEADIDAGLEVTIDVSS
mmetsp:Transcript_8832/g.15026  ORF Transcript_8832/g.15026 Transcript_8832/m.15026 type:complete len:189 (-) Transcript_8832:539-1105(-)